MIKTRSTVPPAARIFGNGTPVEYPTMSKEVVSSLVNVPSKSPVPLKDYEETQYFPCRNDKDYSLPLPSPDTSPDSNLYISADYSLSHAFLRYSPNSGCPFSDGNSIGTYIKPPTYPQKAASSVNDCSSQYGLANMDYEGLQQSQYSPLLSGTCSSVNGIGMSYSHSPFHTAVTEDKYSLPMTPPEPCHYIPAPYPSTDQVNSSNAWLNAPHAFISSNDYSLSVADYPSSDGPSNDADYSDMPSSMPYYHMASNTFSPPSYSYAKLPVEDELTLKTAVDSLEKEKYSRPDQPHIEQIKSSFNERRLSHIPSYADVSLEAPSQVLPRRKCESGNSRSSYENSTAIRPQAVPRRYTERFIAPRFERLKKLHSVNARKSLSDQVPKDSQSRTVISDVTSQVSCIKKVCPTQCHPLWPYMCCESFSSGMQKDEVLVPSTDVHASSDVASEDQLRLYDGCKSCEVKSESLIQSDKQKRFKPMLPHYNHLRILSFKTDNGFIDSHCHLDFLFNRQKYEGTYADYQLEHKDTYPVSYKGCVAVFCNPFTFQKKSMWRRYLAEENVWGAFGCHPHNAGVYNDSQEESLCIALSHLKVRALGEIGLDYSERNRCRKETQHEVFRRQLKIALQRKLNVVIHCRDANEDCMEIMQEILPKDYRIHLHCFTDNWKWAQKWMDAFPNLLIGITNLVTYYSAELTHEVARNIPLERLLLETDAPYFVPRSSPKGTKCSHPGMAIHVAAQIASIRNIPLENVIYHTRSNTYKMYRI